MVATTDEYISVLHLDDDPDFLELAKIRLEQQNRNIRVHPVTRVEDGLTLLESERFDCIVTDYKLGDADGLEFLSAVREREVDADLPVILFTGRGSEEVASQAISMGVTDYLRKGPDPSIFVFLANRIHRFATKRAEEREYRRATELVRQTYERISEGVLSLDGQGRVNYLNSHAATLLGVDAADDVGTSLVEMLPALENTAFDTRLTEAVVSGMETAFSEYVPPLEKWLSVVVYPADNGTTVFLTDVTEIHEKESEIRSLERELATNRSRFRTLHNKLSRPEAGFRS